MKIRPSFITLIISVSIFMFSGCDWDSGGDSNTYNSRYDWVNFSGVYRPTSGTYVVSNFRGGTDASDEQLTRAEQVATGNGSSTTFNGGTSRSDIVPGTFSITAAGFTLVDNGAGTLSGSGATGSIVYATGAWFIDFGGFAPDAGTPITASYSYISSTEASDAAPGSTGVEIFNFNIQHGGEQLSIRDSTGRVYTGRMGSIRSTGGQSQDNPGTVAAPVDGEQVIGLYTVEGVSPAGVKVTITGTLQGTVSGGALTGRSIQGTWIEEGGVSGDVSGQADSITIDANPDPFGFQ